MGVLANLEHWLVAVQASEEGLVMLLAITEPKVLRGVLLALLHHVNSILKGNAHILIHVKFYEGHDFSRGTTSLLTIELCRAIHQASTTIASDAWRSGSGN